jgi:hypothetical protein
VLAAIQDIKQEQHLNNGFSLVDWRGEQKGWELKGRLPVEIGIEIGVKTKRLNDGDTPDRETPWFRGKSTHAQTF